MAQITKAEATAANQLRSPLLRLPAELRNLIYHYALGNCTLTFSDDYKPRLCQHDTPRLCQRDKPAFPLLAVCVQIHAEAALLPYSLNTFVIATAEVLNTFSATTPPSFIQAIKKLDIDYWTVSSQWATEKSLASLKRFKGLEEVTFCHSWSDEMFKHDYEERWCDVAERLQKVTPRVTTSIQIRDLEAEKRREYQNSLCGRTG